MPGRTKLYMGALLLCIVSVMAAQANGAVKQTQATNLRAQLLKLNADCLALKTGGLCESILGAKSVNKVGHEAAAICGEFVPSRPAPRRNILKVVHVDASPSSVNLDCWWVSSWRNIGAAPVGTGFGVPTRRHVLSVPPCSSDPGDGTCAAQAGGGTWMMGLYGVSPHPGVSYNFPLGSVGLKRYSANAGSLARFAAGDNKLVLRMAKALGLPVGGQ